MPKQQRLNAINAEKMLLQAGFIHVRSKGSHRIYIKDNKRIIIPFHASQILHPKIVSQVLKAIED